MKRAMLTAAAAAWLAAAGCAAAPRPEPAHPPDLRARQVAWKWVHPGAIVLEVRAVEPAAAGTSGAGRGLVALARGREEGLVADLRMSVYRDSEWLAALRVLEVQREFTVCSVIGGSAQAIRPGDLAVYLPHP